MIRRLGEATFYRAESPSQTSFISHHSSEISLPSIDYYSQKEDDEFSCNTLMIDKSSGSRSDERKKVAKNCERIVSKSEISKTESNLCQKLSLIVDLVSDFANDANRLHESADELLKELKTKIRVFIYYLDVEMLETEQLLRFNIDRSSICDDRIDWLLHFTKCHKEMRRVLNELSEDVCDDLENCLELRSRGLIGNKPSTLTLSTLSNMQDGMKIANQLINGVPRQRA